MSTTEPVAVLPAPFGLEIPEGWEGTEHPRDGIALELVPEDAAEFGFESRLTVEAFTELEIGPDGAGPMETLIAGRIDLLVATMTDALFLDLSLHGPAPKDDGAPAFAATVVYRHGPHLVTALLWALPAGNGALLLTGLTNSDLFPADVPAFTAIIDSLRLGDAVADPAGITVPEALPEPLVPERPWLPAPPIGWIDADLSDPQLLRQLVADAPGEAPAVITVMAAAADALADGLAEHGRVLNDLATTLTDPDVQQVGVDQIAAGQVHRSLLVFRQGHGSRTADLWTGQAGSGLPTVWVIADLADEQGRAKAVNWVEQATREELGAA